MGIDPISLLAIGGAALGAGGQVLGGIAQGNAYKYNAQVAQNNALIANQNSNYSLAAGTASTQIEGLKDRDQLGKVTAGLAANNVDVNSGSARDVIAGTREIGALDQKNTMQNAGLQAYGYRTQAANYEATAQLDERSAEFAPVGADIGAAGSFLGSLSSIAKLPGTFLAGGTNSNPFPLTSNSTNPYG